MDWVNYKFILHTRKRRGDRQMQLVVSEVLLYQGRVRSKMHICKEMTLTYCEIEEKKRQPHINVIEMPV
jgi:hypothetical protein